MKQKERRRREKKKEKLSSTRVAPTLLLFVNKEPRRGLGTDR